MSAIGSFLRQFGVSPASNTTPGLSGSRAIASLALIVPMALLLGCVGGGSFYRQYVGENPGWIAMMPNEGVDLEETLAGLYTPAAFPYLTLSTRELEIWKAPAFTLTDEDDPRVDFANWEKIEFQDIVEMKYTSENDAEYIVLAEMACKGSDDNSVYFGEKIAWYVLARNSLVAWNHYDYGDLCVVMNTFKPGTGTDIILERRATARIEDHFPTGMIHLSEAYQHGAAYADVGRIREAMDMLDLGDESQNVGTKSRLGFKQGRRAKQRRLATDESTELRRQLLVGTISAAVSAKGGVAAALEDPTIYPAAPPVSAADMPAQEDAEPEPRYYVREKGGWIRVSGYRLRQGEQDGEHWYSFDEMREAEQQADSAK